ncbi:MAG: RNA methyltransferase [Candidatus Nezhaarchaeota archaeon]|nr:RNA methyltransferase [Candidatus Nezhaarchaeota archaeon]
MPPSPRLSKLGVALPASLLSEAPGLREKTLKAGLVGRACAIFRVEEVIVYRDVEGFEKEAKLLVDLLNYLACPQYLRRLVYPLRPEFRYVGVLPPLRTPNHPQEASIDELPPVSYREGVVVERRRGLLIIEAGLERPVEVSGEGKVGEHVVVKIVKEKGEATATLVDRSQVPFYFGFKARLDLRGLSKVVKDSGYDFILATSRLGLPLSEALPSLKRGLRRATLVLYGSPREGLSEIVKREGLSLSDVAELTVNFIPEQGVKTVRTEEALLASLAIINLLSSH